MTSSVVSFSKRNFSENLPGIYEGIYEIPPSENNIPNILYIEDSYYYKPNIDGEQDRVIVPSQQIAESIVNMHHTSQLAYRLDQKPAIFCIPNRMVTVEDLRKDYAKEVKTALQFQRLWFKKLVEIADDDWQISHRHNIISDLQRTAAIELGLKREWITILAEDVEEKPGCPFCGTGLLNPDAPICPTCGRVHNPDKLAALEARFSKTQTTKV